jgi:cysteine desulfurase
MKTMSDSRIYLDNNATTRPLPEVVEAMARTSRDCFANPGSQHADGRSRGGRWRMLGNDCAIVGAKPEQLIFTSGGTESINLALFGFTAKQQPGMIALTGGEHPATVEPCKRLKRSGWKLQMLKSIPTIAEGATVRIAAVGRFSWRR